MAKYEVRWETQAGELHTEIVEADTYTFHEDVGVVFSKRKVHDIGYDESARYNIDCLISIRPAPGPGIGTKMCEESCCCKDGLINFGEPMSIAQFDMDAFWVPRRIRVTTPRYEAEYNIMPSTLTLRDEKP